MDFDYEDNKIPMGSIIYGSLVTLLAIAGLSVLLSILTEMGWTATVTWPNNNVYLIALYIAVVVGSVMAGRQSRQKGLIVGAGVGFLSSILLIFLAFFLHEKISFGIFLVKLFISAFIGAFGGIIGVNLAGNKE